MNSDLKYIIIYLYDCCKDKYFEWIGSCFRNTKLINFPDEWYDHLYNLDNYSIKMIEKTVEDICYCYNDFDDTYDCGIHYVNELVDHIL